MEGDPPEPDDAHWLVDRTNPDLPVLIARNAIGRYPLANANKLYKASLLLAPAAIEHVLAGRPASKRLICGCQTGLEKPRCYHKFTFNDIREARGERYSSNDPLGAAVQRLKALQPQSGPTGLADVATLATPRTIVYFVGRTRVCRSFYMACNGFSKKKTDKISAMVRGAEVVKPVRPMNYVAKETKRMQGINFWRTFFGEQAQSSAPGHRYFPVNMSYYYIYVHEFWPWWKDQRGDWSVLPSRPPGANAALYEATANRAKLTTPESIQNRLLQLRSEFKSQSAMSDDDEDEEEKEEEGYFDWYTGEARTSASAARAATAARVANAATAAKAAARAAEAARAVRPRPRTRTMWNMWS